MSGGNIPNNLKPLFVGAGRQYHIAPQVLAGVADVESTLGSDRSTSSAGAVGLMQFLPSTARSIGIDPFNDRQAIYGAAKLLNQMGYQQNPLRALGAYNGGPGNPQYSYANLVMQQAGRLKGQIAGVGPAGPAPQQQRTGPGGGTTTPGVQVMPQTTVDQAGLAQARNAYIAGNFLSQTSKSNPWNIGPKSNAGAGVNLFSPGLLSTSPPNPADFTSTTFKVAQNQLQRLAGPTNLAPHPGAAKGYKGYVNPIHGFALGRTDMGVDANAPVGTPIRAIGDSQLVQVVGNWFQGQPLLLFKLMNGPKAGQYWYVSEQVAPRVHQGQVVHAGDVIGTYAPSGTGIEIGWGSPSTNSRTLAGPHYTEGAVTAEGTSFRNFLGALH